jgi:hypothetical protein
MWQWIQNQSRGRCELLSAFASRRHSPILSFVARDRLGTQPGGQEKILSLARWLTRQHGIPLPLPLQVWGSESHGERSAARSSRAAA